MLDSRKCLQFCFILVVIKDVSRSKPTTNFHCFFFVYEVFLSAQISPTVCYIWPAQIPATYDM